MHSSDTPLVSVIIVNYNSGQDVHECLQALYNHTDIPFEVIVVDNASTDGSVSDLTNRFPTVKLLLSDVNLGYARGINLGLAAVRGAYAVILNMDVLVTQNWLSPLVNILRDNPDVGAVTPCILLHSSPDTVNALGQNINVAGLGFNRHLNWPREEVDRVPVRVSGLHGAAFAMRTELFRDLEGMNAAYFLYHEDVELSLRITLAGYHIYMVPGSVVLHKYSLHMTPQKLHWLERHRWMTILSMYRASTYLLLAPFLLMTEFMMAGYCLTQGLSYVKAKTQAIGWVLGHWQAIRESRRWTQKMRQVPDKQVLSSLRWWYDWDQFRVLAKQKGGWLYEIMSSLFTWRAHDRAA